MVCLQYRWKFHRFRSRFLVGRKCGRALAILLMVAYKAMPLIGLLPSPNVLNLYMKPRKEERAILFMDLIGSTTLTERIGNAGFMRFLNDSIFAMTHAIFRNNGSIYRYVGDEIIISWPAADASRALQCAFDIEKALKQRRAHFKQSYDTFPRFRYGLHLGEVMMGELGDLRVEIAMIGDAINTTKRIEDACRHLILTSWRHHSSWTGTTSTAYPSCSGRRFLCGVRPVATLWTCHSSIAWSLIQDSCRLTISGSTGQATMPNLKTNHSSTALSQAQRPNTQQAPHPRYAKYTRSPRPIRAPFPAMISTALRSNRCPLAYRFSTHE